MAEPLNFYLDLEMFILFKCPATEQNQNNNFSIELQVQNTGTMYCQNLLSALGIWKETSSHIKICNPSKLKDNLKITGWWVA